MPFENLVFRPRSQGGPNLCILDFQTPDEFSNPDPGLPTHPGMKYFRKETLAVDMAILKTCLFVLHRPSIVLGKRSRLNTCHSSDGGEPAQLTSCSLCVLLAVQANE